MGSSKLQRSAAHNAFRDYYIKKYKMLDEPDLDSMFEDERDPQEITVRNGFWIGRYEVTTAQWRGVMGNRMPRTPWKDEQDEEKEIRWRTETDRPVVVMPDDAIAFSEILTASERRAGRIPLSWEYRLPTEAEWEYACRAGSSSSYGYGEDPASLGEYAWFVDNSDDSPPVGGFPVGRKKPNSWGIFDMHGNVFEFCANDGRASLKESVGLKSVQTLHSRGGSTCCYAYQCRASYRKGNPCAVPGIFEGFRLVLSDSVTKPAVN